MATRNVYIDNVLREAWNDDTSTVTFYNSSGAQTSSRAYTAPERAAADVAIARLAAGANESSIRVNLNQDLVDMQTIIDTNNAALTYTPAMMKQFARAIRRLDRIALGKFDGAT